MLMLIRENHGAGDILNRYCKYCAPGKNLRSRGKIREGLRNRKQQPVKNLFPGIKG
jgi:hypothetical protein